MGVLRSGTKSDFLKCLQDLVPVSVTVQVTCTILDSAAIINMLRPGTAKTFHDYAADVFMPYNTSYLEHVTRLDIIWDKYVPESLLMLVARGERG